MSDFFKKFLLEDPRKLSAGGRYVGLAAFGKHPGWDDFVEDLGMETESLNLAKTVLYVKGIGGQIDSGEWEKLETEQQFPVFKHVFVWQRSGQILVGRLWSSSDGKGRARYPMVVCLHFVGVTLAWALKQALPALENIEEGCVQTTSAEDVRGLLNRKRAAFREAIQSTDGKGEYAPVTPEALYKILQPAADAKSESFFRVLYQLQSQWGAFAAGKFNARTNPAAVRAQQIRVPAAGENPEQALLFWSRFFQTQVDSSVPLLLTLPLEAGWVDVTAGEPESHEFFCLRASPKAVPMVSEVPYTLDDEFRTTAAAFLNGFQRGEMTAPDFKPATAVTPFGDSPTPNKGGWLKWLGVGVVLVSGVLAAKVLLLKDGKQEVAVSVLEKSEVALPVVKIHDTAPVTRAADSQNAQAAAASATNGTDPKPIPPDPSPPQQARGEITNSIGMVFVALPSGIWVGKYEVTQAEYQEVMGANPSRSTNDLQSLQQPVEFVNWNEARLFCHKLTERESGKLPAGKVYRLPTEKHWQEFAGGQKFEDIPSGLRKSGPSVVGQSGPANKFGLFDVIGNVWEWCWDDAIGKKKVLKGGSFRSGDYYRTLRQYEKEPDCGFRCIIAAQ